MNNLRVFTRQFQSPYWLFFLILLWEPWMLTVAQEASQAPIRQTENVEDVAEKNRVAAVLKTRAAQQLDLSKENWRHGTTEMLQNMGATPLVKMQVFRIDWRDNVIVPRDRTRYTKHYMEAPFGVNSRRELESVLALVKSAKPIGGRQGCAPFIPDRSLVIQPLEQEPFEILYESNSGVLADVGSTQLRDALCALSENTRITIIRMREKAIIGVLYEYAIAAHRGGVYGQGHVKMELLPDKGLVLSLDVIHEGKSIVRDAQSVQYGNAYLYQSPVGETVIVHLEDKSDPTGLLRQFSNRP